MVVKWHKIINFVFFLVNALSFVHVIAQSSVVNQRLNFVWDHWRDPGYCVGWVAKFTAWPLKSINMGD